jgi:hypothetical protein
MLWAMGELADTSGFLVALLVASGASVVMVVVARGAMRAVALGVTAAGATVVGLHVDDVLDRSLVVALVLVVVGTLAAENRPLVVRVAALTPGGALLVTVAADGTPGWARALAFVALVGGGPAAAGVDRRFPVLTFALLTVSALGAYATVPDTEQARVLVGALLPVAVISTVWRRVPDPSGPATVVALLAWVALVGGIGRPASVVGALGCLGVLALGPLAGRCGPIRLGAVHIGVVVIASRVAGLRQSAWTALAIVVPTMVVAALVLAAGERGPARNPS